MKKLDVPQSGSQGQTTASHNRFGQYDRQRSTPTQPRTAAQLAIRAIMATVAQAWRGLGDDARLQWGNYAAMHPRQDSLGQTIVLTGSQQFNAINAFNLTAGDAIQAVVPDDTAILPPPLTVGTATAAGLSVTTDDSVPTTSRIVVKVSPPMSAGRSFNGDFRIVKSLAGTASAAQVILTAADLTAKYGALAAGQKYFIRVQVLDAGNVSPATDTAVVLT